MYLISACLAGVNCKYNGGNNECRWVKEFMKGRDCMLVCPECEGSMLPIPRPPAEFINGRAIDKEGRDITGNLFIGSDLTMLQVQKRAAETEQDIELAILKANSPSCGSGKIYDGTFSGVLVDGDGMFAEMLKKRGILVFTEKQQEELEKYLRNTKEATGGNS